MTCEHGRDPSCQRCEIIDAKRNLYHLILKLGVDKLTDDDRRMGLALVQDSEIQKILDTAKDLP